MERVGERQEKMERYCSTGQSPQRAAAPTEENDYYYYHHLLAIRKKANAMIIQVHYDTMYYYDVVGYLSSDVTSDAL